MTTHPPLADFLRWHPRTKYLDAFIADLCGIPRGKRYPIAAAEKVFRGEMRLPGSTVLLAVTGDSLDPDGIGFSDGDPDEVAMPIVETLAPAPWLHDCTAQVLLTLQGLDGAPYYYEPRNVLARVLARFSELQLRPVAAFELEFYLFDAEQLRPPVAPGSGRRATDTQVYGMAQVEEFADYLHAVCDACAAAAIACGAISAEYAPAQFEINLPHSDDLLRAADECVLFQRAVRDVAVKHGMRASFIAKPYFAGDDAASGSGLHLHISLRDAAGRNAFAETGEFGAVETMTPALQHALGGLRATMAEAMAVFAPNANSYRRFVPQSYVPLAADWGFENRAVALRVPKSGGKSRRIEHRVAGADANPYLTLAAALAGVHYGVVNRLATGAPGPAEVFDLPVNANDSFAAARRGSILPGYFGERYLRAYLSCKEQELQAFAASGAGDEEWYL